MIARRWLAPLLLVAAPLIASSSCGGATTPTAASTKPMSPAEGAGDYNPQNGSEAAGLPTAPIASGAPSASAGAVEASDCPPKCADDGGWIGCGVKKSRGKGCATCAAPKCKNKGTPDEGWYDCTGVLIVPHDC